MADYQFKVTFKNTGASEGANAGEKLMDVTKRANWPIPYGCEDGMCGTCLIKNSAGLSKMDDKERQTLDVMGFKEEEGYRLACQCTVEGDSEIEQ